MKAKKLISVFLVAVMLVVPFALVVNAASAYTIANGPLKTVYTDGDYFIPQGLTLTNGTETVEYSPADKDFKFDPAINELLAVTVDELGNVVPTPVRVFYKNEYVGAINVTVSHVPGPIVSMGEGGHGRYCEGCGKVVEFEEHNITEWIPNDDRGFFLCQTETGVCTVCGQSVTRDIKGSERFLEIFDFGQMTETEVKIVQMFHTIVVSLVQALVGIK